MSSRFSSNLSIIEAVETLSSIADLEVDRGHGVGIAHNHEVILNNERIAYKTVYWFHEQDATTTVALVKETFRVILHYLKQFYKKEYGYVTDPKTIEGIKTIMVLVGEAAKKLDRYTSLFYHTHQKSIKELKEYKQLQEFYLSKIARKIDEGVLSRWILGLSLGRLPKVNQGKAPKLVAAPVEKKEETKHIFVDLETVKKDSEYELFFIRKEDGGRFFSPRLLRNIKLVCDFGDYFGETKQADPLEQIAEWRDKVFQASAVNLLSDCKEGINLFYQTLFKQAKEEDVTESLNKAIVALMLSSHPTNLLKNNPIKNCEAYFADFLIFLRETLKTKTYQKWIVYPPKDDYAVGHDLVDLIQGICASLYTSLKGYEDLLSIVHVLIHDATTQVSKEHKEQARSSRQLWSHMAADYAAMSKLIKRHPNGPLFKVLNLLEDNGYNSYDPLMQHNLPCQLFNLSFADKKIEHIRFATPISQEFINKALVNEEFKSFILDYERPDRQMTHLLFNLEDRTSWKEHSRCVALEELQFSPEFKRGLTVVTLAVDTDFYNQLAPYHQVNHADAFIEQFKEHLKGEGSGFYFPKTIDTKELFGFIDNSLNVIHQLFFNSKNVLLREHRIDFIEIAYLFIQMKIIDMLKPDSFSFTCKDSVDLGMASSAEFFAMIKFLNDSQWTEDNTDLLNYLIYAFPLIIRERMMLPERFNRMLSAIKAIENAQNEVGAYEFSKMVKDKFQDFFKNGFLDSKLL